ncbi:unnamed protein product [Prunus armeniaca]|uniref:UBC core domain-containing protein n=1 Tax=Prunus armeniaca TaxID=36596 RepID=A0A6J5XD68_PRUAR|nr:unnamed protein product [Prunus armeniaca]
MALRLRDSHGHWVADFGHYQKGKAGQRNREDNLTDPWMMSDYKVETINGKFFIFPCLLVFMKAGFGKSELSFMNKIFHPNVDELSGSVYLDVINQSWSPMFVVHLRLNASGSMETILDAVHAKANTNDMGPLSLDFFRKNNLSASWKVIGEKTSITDKIYFTAVDSRQETPKVKVDVSSGGDHAQLVDPAKLARRIPRPWKWI